MDPQIKAIYFRLENLLANLPNSEKRYRIDASIVESYHHAVDELSAITKKQLDHFKVSQSNAQSGYGNDGNEVLWLTDAVKTQIASLLGHIKGMYSLDQTTASLAGGQPTITVINQNTVAVTLNLTLSQLIEKSKNQEEKKKLTQLDQELSAPNKNWDNIKGILVWVANFSKDLFFQLLPIILKQYGVS